METSLASDGFPGVITEGLVGPSGGQSPIAGETARLGAAMLDITQIFLLGFGLGVLLEVPLGPVQLALLAVAAALLTTASRCLLRRVTETDGPSPHPLAAAMAVLLGIAAVSTCVLPVSSVPELLVAWLVWWGVGSATLSALLRLTWVRLAPDSFMTRIAVLGPTFDQFVDRDLGAALKGRRHRLCFATPDSPEGIVAVRQLALKRTLDVVVLAVMPNDEARLGHLLAELDELPTRLCLGLPVSAGAHLVDLNGNPHACAAGVVKRGFDILLSGIALVALLPVLAVVALAICLETPGPALFRQYRFGAGGQPFEVLKFRTMRNEVADRSGERRTLERDPRVTRLGRILRRTSIDELPQLLNVFRGDMSLVGPRPHPMSMKVEGVLYGLAVEGYRSRHRVRPGITGWAQINGSRGEVDTLSKARRRVELDAWYIQHWSLLLDFRIILRTVCGGFASFRAD